MKITNHILKPPCIFCHYDGPRYWNKQSHDPDCPFFNIESRKRRINAFVNSVSKLWILGKNRIDAGKIEMDD